jgi:hypothetical protein
MTFFTSITSSFKVFEEANGYCLGFSMIEGVLIFY